VSRIAIPYRWGCSFIIRSLRVPTGTIIDGIELETTLLEDGTSRTTGNFILELSARKLPDKEIEEKVNLLTDALTVMYNFGAIDIAEPKLVNEEEILSGGQDTPLNSKLQLTMNIFNRQIVQPNIVQNTIQNLKQNPNKDSYVIALRWMRKASREKDIVDRFVAYWIALNALYHLHSTHGREAEQALIKEFVRHEFNTSMSKDLLLKTIDMDKIETISNSGLTLRSRPITAELKTLWEQLKGGHSDDFTSGIEILLLCIYALRNNIFHGVFVHGQHRQLINESSVILIELLRCVLHKTLSIV
jgi:hypothetical protein